MTSSVPQPVIQIPVQRDRWDTIALCCGSVLPIAIAGWGVLFIVVPLVTRAPELQWIGFPLAAYFLLVRFPMSLAFQLAWWKALRHEQLELDDAEFKWYLGWGVFHIPLTDVDRVTPMGITYGLMHVRRGLRIWTNAPPQLLPQTPLSFLNQWLIRFTKRCLPTVRSNPKQLHYDIAPRTPEKFLHELALRAPHLQLDGNHLFRRTQ